MAKLDRSHWTADPKQYILIHLVQTCVICSNVHLIYLFFLNYMGKLQGHNPLKQSHITLLKQKTRKKNISYIELA